jgi:hypothetical protein
MDLSLRWGGCMSVALWVCSQEDWDYVSKLHADNADIGNHVTFHAVLGHGAYPYNLQRNVALAPFAPWAVGNGRPAPWVVVADADGVPSVGEAQMSRAVTEAAAGKATAPPVITGAVPAELAWMGTGPLGIGAPEFDAAPFEYAAAKPEVCAGWDGLPEPMQCRASGHPSGLGWGRSWQTAAWATDRSRCGRPVDPARAFFVIPSFDTRRDNGEAIARLRAIDPNSPPSHAWAYLRKLWDHGIVELQAQESYAPSYESMVPWRAWRDAHPAGLLAVHYAEMRCILEGAGAPELAARAAATLLRFTDLLPADAAYHDAGCAARACDVRTCLLKRRALERALVPTLTLDAQRGLDRRRSRHPRHAQHFDSHSTRAYDQQSEVFGDRDLPVRRRGAGRS